MKERVGWVERERERRRWMDKEWDAGAEDDWQTYDHARWA